MGNYKNLSKWAQIQKIKMCVIMDLISGHQRISDLSAKYCIEKRTIYGLIINLKSTGWQVAKKGSSYKITKTDPHFRDIINQLNNSINQNEHTDTSGH